MQDALLPGLFNFAKQYAIKGVQAKYEWRERNVTCQLLVCAHRAGDFDDKT
jgi:hypothetical protein